MDRSWVVVKYGGTSVASLATWRQIVARTRALLAARHRVWVVVSALSTVTNALLAALDEAVAPATVGSSAGAGAGAGGGGGGGGGGVPSFERVAGLHRALAADMGLSAAAFAPVAGLLDDLRRLLDGVALTGEVSPRLRARVAAYGELLSSALGAAFLPAALGDALAGGAPARVERVDSRTLLTSTAGEEDGAPEADAFLEADVRPSTQVDRAEAAARGADVVICPGFIASTPRGATCLLGRGGSDTSAALLAALVGAARLEIWTDVNGMFTADPRFVPRARLIRSLTYREAQELAAMGARVLHPRCLLPAAFAGFPVEVRNTMDASDDAEITVVCADGRLDGYRGAAGRRRGADAAAAAHASPAGGGAGGAGGAGGTGGAGGAAAVAFAAGRGGGGGGGGAGGTPSFTAMPPPRAPSPVALPPAGGEGGPPSPTASPSAAGRASPGAALASWRGGGAPPSGASRDGAPKVLAVARRKGVTLVDMSAYEMWGHAGFLNKVFAPFGAQGVSVDLIATSQYAVSVTLDHIPDGVHGDTFRRVTAALSKICTTTVRHPCAVVSVVGRALRNALPALGRAMAVFDGVRCHMVSEASEDLNMSFVVDEDAADALVAALHGALLESDAVAADDQFGPIWADLPCGKAPLPGDAKH